MSILRGARYDGVLVSPSVRAWCEATRVLSSKIRDGECTLMSPRYSAPVLFPLLDSFPASIFDLASGHATKIAVHTGLTTSTAVADQLRAIEQFAKRLVGIEDREALCNGLQVLAEEYDEGWNSGTDSDADD